MVKPMNNECKHCGAPIFFARSCVTGKKVPLDTEPLYIVPGDYGETVYRVIDGLAIRTRGQRVSKPGPLTVIAFKCHMVTCENRPHGNMTEAEYRARINDAKLQAEERERERERQKAAEEAAKAEKRAKEAAEREAAAAQFCLFGV